MHLLKPQKLLRSMIARCEHIDICMVGSSRPNSVQQHHQCCWTLSPQPPLMARRCFKIWLADESRCDDGQPQLQMFAGV